MTERLAVYGTLAPGGPNEHVLAELDGAWSEGTVRGHLREQGWGSELGYPGIELADDAPPVDVALFTSDALDGFWPLLDTFEGSGYSRVRTAVSTGDGSVEAWIYVLAG